jgi:hypothetical protein
MLTEEQIEAERAEGMSEERIASEYYCDFDAPVPGAYYGDYIKRARDDGRIGKVPHQPELPVHTAWDIGIGDSTSIWFYQQVGPNIHVIDFMENNNVGVDWYAKELQTKPYVYGNHWGPHDLKAKVWGTGKTQAEMARQQGIDFKIAPSQSIEDGIQSARAIFSRCIFDDEKCEKGLDCLVSYRKEWDEAKQTFKDNPLHDWSSHAADAFRYLAVSIRDQYIMPKPVFENEIPFGEQVERHIKRKRSATDEARI